MTTFSSQGDLAFWLGDDRQWRGVIGSKARSLFTSCVTAFILGMHLLPIRTLKVLIAYKPQSGWQHIPPLGTLYPVTHINTLTECPHQQGLCATVRSRFSRPSARSYVHLYDRYVALITSSAPPYHLPPLPLLIVQLLLLLLIFQLLLLVPLVQPVLDAVLAYLVRPPGLAVMTRHSRGTEEASQREGTGGTRQDESGERWV